MVSPRSGLQWFFAPVFATLDRQYWLHQEGHELLAFIGPQGGLLARIHDSQVTIPVSAGRQEVVGNGWHVDPQDEWTKKNTQSHKD